MPSGSVRSEADIEACACAARRRRPSSCDLDARRVPAASMSLPQRRHVHAGPREQLAHVREILGAYPPSRAHQGAAAAPGRVDQHDTNMSGVAADVGRHVLAVVGVLASRAARTQRLAGHGLDCRAVRQSVFADVVGLGDAQRRQHTARAPGCRRRVVAGRANDRFEAEGLGGRSRSGRARRRASPRNTATPETLRHRVERVVFGASVVASTTARRRANISGAGNVRESSGRRSTPAPCPAGGTSRCGPAG